MLKNFKNILFDSLETFAVSSAVLLVVYMFVAFPIVVYGASMEPSLHTGERILVEKISFYFDDVSRGDVVVLHPPGNDSVEYVKRVIGLPGEVVKVYECVIYISKDGKKFMLVEPYLSKEQCTAGGQKFREGRSVKVDEGQYVVLGDNRERSADSRLFGPIQKDRILGKAIFRFWPLDKIGLL